MTDTPLLSKEIIEKEIRRREKKKRFASTLGILAGSSHLAFYEVWPHLSNNPQLIEKMKSAQDYQLPAIISSLGVGVIFNILPHINFHAASSTRKNLAHIERICQAMVMTLTGKMTKEKQYEYYMAIATETEDPIRRIQALATCDAIKGEYESALEKYRPLFQMMNPQMLMQSQSLYEKVTSPLDAMVLPVLSSKVTQHFVGKKEVMIDQVSTACTLIGKGRFPTAKRMLNEMLKNNRDFNIELNCVYAYALQSMNDPEANAQWVETIETIFRSDALETHHRRIADSKNEVLEYEGSALLKNTFIFKRNLQTMPIYNEYYNLNALRDALGPQGFPTPVGAFSSRQHAYLVYHRQPGRTLDTIIGTDQEHEMIRCAIDHMLELHLRLMWKADLELKIKPQKSYVQRIIKAVTERTTPWMPRVKQEFTSVLESLCRELDEHGSSQIIHGDLHPGNILIPEHGFNPKRHSQECMKEKFDDLLLIDFENVSYAARIFDYVCLIENTNEKDQYIDYISKQAHPFFSNKNLFFKDYYTAACFKNLQYLSYLMQTGNHDRTLKRIHRLKEIRDRLGQRTRLPEMLEDELCESLPADT